MCAVLLPPGDNPIAVNNNNNNNKIVLHVFFTLPDDGFPQKLKHVAITNTNIVVIEGFYFLVAENR
jgi:hypothetical protein